MKNRRISLFSFITLLLFYLLLSYPLFDLHGMKQWPMVLMVFGGIVIIIFGIYFKNHILSLFTSFGYILSFLIAYLLQQDYGNSLNNLWIIWSFSYLIFMMLGILFSYYKKKYKK